MEYKLYKKDDIARQLVKRLADEEIKLNIKDAKIYVDEMIEAVKDLIVEGDVKLEGLVRLEHQIVGARTYRNPKDGTEIEKPEHEVLKATLFKKVKNLEL